MKRFLLGTIYLLGLVGTLQAQSVNITLDAGLLKTAGGGANVPVGGLLQLIASPSGSFSAPTSSSYVTGDNVLVQSFAMNYGGGQAGETTNTFNGLLLSTSSYTITSGEKLLLRFYPNLTASSAPAMPTLGTSYGQVRSDTIEFGGTIDPSETAWVVPAAGTQADLNYITMSAGNGGTYANNTAFASGIVGVPEPSTTGLIGGLTVSLLGLARLRRRA